MPPIPKHRGWDQHLRRGTALLLLTLLLLSALTLLFSATGFKRQLDALSVADSDNQGWTVSQLDVSHRALLLELRETFSGLSPGDETVPPREMAGIRRAFDIYYGRISVVIATLGTWICPTTCAGNWSGWRANAMPWPCASTRWSAPTAGHWPRWPRICARRPAGCAPCRWTVWPISCAPAPRPASSSTISMSSSASRPGSSLR